MNENKQVNEKLNRLTPKEIVVELDKYIVGQKKAKRAVAVALRNRIRRLKLDPELREDIAPKNILMIGPTGVGKTEIARRLAKLAGSPFLKVEATKYTEVGYVGRDVESMVRDLMAAGFQMVKQEMQESVTQEAEKRAEEALLDLLLPTNSRKQKDKKPKPGPVVRPMGAFSINPENSNGSIIGTTLQVGIPIFSKKPTRAKIRTMKQNTRRITARLTMKQLRKMPETTATTGSRPQGKSYAPCSAKANLTKGRWN